jgi:hypothetical protein
MVIGGLVLIGGSGAAALYVGADSLLGPSYEEVNGLECTTLQMVKIKRNDRYWIRKYVFTESGDGMARLKTALRVAKAVHEVEKADLVQVSVLDKSGPTQRAAMRGRAIGAQVVYIPDPQKAPDPSDPVYTAFYLEGAPSPSGEYFGLRIDPPLEDVMAMSAALTDTADCLSPVVEGEAAGAHGAAKDAHGKDSKAKDAGGHASPADHEAKPDAHGEEKPQPDAEGENPGADGEGHEVGGEAEEGGLLSSLTGMIFGGSGSAAAGQPHEAAAAAQTADATDHTQPSDEHTAVAKEPGIVDRIKQMMFGPDNQNVVVEHPSAITTSQAHSPEPDQRTAHESKDGIDPMKVAAPVDTAPVAPAEPVKPSH